MRVVKLPSGYRQVDYIESTGTQYIDTGYKPNSETKVIAEVQMFSTENNQETIFGARTSSSSKAYGNNILTASYRLFYNNGYSDMTIEFDVSKVHTVVQDKNVMTIGAYSISRTYAAFQCDYSMYLFAMNQTDAARFFARAKLYGCQIYDDGVLIRDYIPCKTTANIAGLYDLVEGKFYGNAGTGAFLYGAPKKLPQGYRRLTHIESSGTQYIDTGIIPTNHQTEIKFDMMDYKDNDHLFGTSADYRKYSFTSYANEFRSGINGVEITIAPWTTGVHTLLYNAIDNYGIYLDGKLYASGTLCASTTNLTLCRRGTTGFTGRIYYVKITDRSSGLLVRDFVPCISDGGEVGLYDDINGVFYGNAGTGTFTAGQRVYAEDEITKLEYIESTGTQYVDTGFVPNQDTGVTIDFQLNSVTGWQCVFGARTGNNTKSYSLWHSGTVFGFYYANANSNFSNLSGTSRHTVNAIKNTVIADSANSVSLGYSTFAADYSMYLFAVNSDGAAQSNSSMKLFACQIYDNGAIARDYYPATADGIIGLWDAISGVLYENAGTGTFIAGPIIYEGLAAPENLLAETTGNGVFLSWDSVETAIGYRVYRDHLFIAESAATEYADNEMQKWEQYTYSVSAFNETEEGAAASVAVVFTSDNPILDLITDRTAADANRVLELSQKDFASEMTYEEQREFLSSMKGAYNASDLNRVGVAIQYIADRINSYGTLVKVSPKTDWIKSDIPTPAQLTSYLAEISLIRVALEVMKNTPAVPGDMENFTYNEANNIEQILLDVDLLITNMTLAWFYCGEIYSGEVW